MGELSVLAWVLLALGAVIVGVSKTALPGAGTVAVILFASALPARQSTATLLVLLIVGDLFALAAYRRHADWRALLRLAPAVVVGMIAGALFLAWASDEWVRRGIGIVLLVLVGVSLVVRRRATSARSGRALAAGYGTLGGFSTMVANAGGPVMTLYFIAARFDMLRFLGTAAWFFFVVNVAKLPFAIGLGLLTVDGLLLDLVLVPAVLAGALAGRAIARRIAARWFEWIVIGLTVAGAVYLLF